MQTPLSFSQSTRCPTCGRSRVAAVRPATESDLPVLMSLYEQARHIMRASGNLHQWTGGYPDVATVLADIRGGYSQLCLDDGGQPVATFAFLPGPSLLTPASMTARGWTTRCPTACCIVWPSTPRRAAWPKPVCAGAMPASPTCVPTRIVTTTSCAICCRVTVSITAASFTWPTATSGWLIRLCTLCESVCCRGFRRRAGFVVKGLEHKAVVRPPDEYRVVFLWLSKAFRPAAGILAAALFPT